MSVQKGPTPKWDCQWCGKPAPSEFEPCSTCDGFLDLPGVQKWASRILLNQHRASYQEGFDDGSEEIDDPKSDPFERDTVH